MLDTDEIVEELSKTLKCEPGEILAKVQRLLDKIKALKEFANECTTFRG